MEQNKVNKILKIFVRGIIILLCGWTLYRGDYSNLGILLLTMLLTFYDVLLEKVCKIKLSNHLNILLITLIFLAQCLGTVLNFYKIFTWWDIMLHTLSGIIFYLFGHEFLLSLQKKDKSVQLNTFILIIFSFCFALSTGVIWEIFEYSVDFVLEKDTQLARNFIGRDALKDTMTDLISASIGAFTIALIEYKINKNEKGGKMK